MGQLLVIDPGPEKSGIVVVDSVFREDGTCDVLASGEPDTFSIVDWVWNRCASVQSLHVEDASELWELDGVVCEDIVSMGKMVGRSTFSTCKVIGRLQEAYRGVFGGDMPLISRRDVKTVLAGGTTLKGDKGARVKVTDAVISGIIKVRYPETGGGKTPSVGTKGSPGPLYGIKGHAWQALAVALTYLETKNR